MNVDELRGEVARQIRDVPDFPKSGILFKDITPLLLNPVVFAQVVCHFAEYYKDRNVTSVVSPEARGFILGAVLAHELGVGFIPARKPGKLPCEVEALRYCLEYGEDEIQVHKDAINSGDRVLVCDDLIATGGTARATCQLIEKMGASVIGVCFLIELAGLGGDDKLKDYDVYSLISY